MTDDMTSASTKVAHLAFCANVERSAMQAKPLKEMAPQVELEPTTLRLTAGWYASEPVYFQ